MTILTLEISWTNMIVKYNKVKQQFLKKNLKTNKNNWLFVNSGTFSNFDAHFVMPTEYTYLEHATPLFLNILSLMVYEIICFYIESDGVEVDNE